MRREGKLGVVRIADHEPGAVLLVIGAGADLAPVAELLAEVEPVIEGVDTILRTLLLPDEERQVAIPHRGVRHDEPAGKVRQRQEHLGREERGLSDLRVRDPFPARARDVGHHVARRQVVVGIALEVVLQAEAEAHVVGADGIAARIDQQPILVILLHDTIVQRVETTLAV